MLPVQDIYNRIIWDTRLNEDAFIIGFAERTSETGMGEKHIIQWSVNGDIPWHRIRYVRCGDMIVWDRETNLDLFSTDKLPEFAWKVENNDDSQDLESQTSDNLSSNSYESSYKSSYESLLEVEGIEFKARSVYKYDGSTWEEVEKTSNCVNQEIKLEIKPKNINLEKLSVVSFNILYDLFETDKIQTEKRVPTILQHLQESDADIIAIEEATPDFVKQLFSQNWVRDRYYVSESVNCKCVKPYGNLLISRLPFTLVEHRLSAHKRLMVGSFLINGEVLQVGVVHLTSDHSENAEQKRKYQLTVLLKYLKTLCGSGLILGDFNCRGNQLEDLLREYNFIDLWEELRPDEMGYTFDPKCNPLAKLMSLRGEPARFDRIVLNSPDGIFKADSIHLFACEPVEGTNGEIYPSDHFGINAVIKVKTKEEINSTSQPSSDRNDGNQYHSKAVENVSLKSIPPTYRSAIVIIPPADILEKIDDIRCLYDARYERWMPHINLIYGFLPDSYFEKALELISSTLKDVEPFEITLDSFQTFTHRKSSTAWLRPQTNPAKALTDLQTALQTLFPQCDEQSKKSKNGFTPHMSVGQFSNPQEAFSKLPEWEPVTFTVSSIALISRRGNEPFEIRHVIPFNQSPEKQLKVNDNSNPTLIQLVNNIEPGLTPKQRSHRQTVLEIVKQTCSECLGFAASLHLFGSERLGVSTVDSDLDTVCEIPNYVNPEIFLENVEKHLIGLCDSSQLVKDARVPILRLQLEGISVDLLYAQVESSSTGNSIDSNTNLKTNKLKIKSDSTSFKAMVGCWEADTIIQTVEKYIPLSTFTLLLRTIRAWAKSRFIYSNTYGFCGGFSYAVLAAWSIQNYDFQRDSNKNVPLGKLLSHFFKTLSEHDWSQPISLTNAGREYKVRLPNDRMPVITSISPCQNTTRNVTKSTFKVLSKEFQRGAEISNKAISEESTWKELFKSPQQHKPDFNGLIQIEISSQNQEDLKNSLSLVESHIVGLIIQLEHLDIFVRPHTKPEIFPNNGIIKLSIQIPNNCEIKQVKEASNRFLSQFTHLPSTFSIKISTE